MGKLVNINQFKILYFMLSFLACITTELYVEKDDGGIPQELNFCLSLCFMEMMSFYSVVLVYHVPNAYQMHFQSKNLRRASSLNCFGQFSLSSLELSGDRQMCHDTLEKNAQPFMCRKKKFSHVVLH